MRLAWATDIHLDGHLDEAQREFAREICNQRANILLLTGDIANAREIKELLPELARLIGIPVYYVLGNHDFYGGSIQTVRKWARQETERHILPGHPPFTWMESIGVVELSAGVAMVGVDGWGDGWRGNFDKSMVLLNDWAAIREFKNVNAMYDRKARLKILRQLGAEEGAKLTTLLSQAFQKYKRVLVLTHVPPWREACWHEGKYSDDNWLPWFSCAETGQAIVDAVAKFPDARVTVLCGHTHGRGYSKISEQIDVYTGGADYCLPEVQGFFTIDNGELSALQKRIEPL